MTPPDAGPLAAVTAMEMEMEIPRGHESLTDGHTQSMLKHGPELEVRIGRWADAECIEVPHGATAQTQCRAKKSRRGKGKGDRTPLVDGSIGNEAAIGVLAPQLQTHAESCKVPRDFSAVRTDKAHHEGELKGKAEFVPDLATACGFASLDDMRWHIESASEAEKQCIQKSLERFMVAMEVPLQK